MALAVSGLSPVIITVRMPIWRSSAKRSTSPSLTMSFRWTTPRMRAVPSAVFCATTSGVPPLTEIASTRWSSSAVHAGRDRAALLDPGDDRRAGALADDRPVGQVETRHPGLRGERHDLAGRGRIEADAAVGRERHDRRALGRRVGERGERCGPLELGDVDAGHRDELARAAVAVRDRAGLVEQQRRDVARRLDRAARHREHVALHEAVHAGDADGREQRADRRRDEADEQGDEHRDARRAPPRRTRSGSA